MADRAHQVGAGSVDGNDVIQPQCQFCDVQEVASLRQGMNAVGRGPRLKGLDLRALEAELVQELLLRELRLRDARPAQTDAATDRPRRCPQIWRRRNRL